MILINFSHPLSTDQLDRLAKLVGQPIENVIALPTQFEQSEAFVPQVEALIDQVPLKPDEWQTAPIVVVLPSLNYIAAVLLAEMHGRMGYFPSIVRLSPVPGALPPRFEVTEVLNLHEVREKARKKRL